MTVLGDLVTRLTANVSGLQSGLAKGQSLTQRYTAGVSASLSGLIRMAGPLTAAFAGIYGGASSVNAANTQIKAEKRLAAVLSATRGAVGLSTEQLKSYAAELQGVTNFGDEVTIGAASILATFKDIKGNVFKDAIASMQDMSTIMGTDLNSSAVQLGKALNDPIRGVSALTRVGVSFTQQQKDQIKTMQKAGDILGAQKIIISELQSEFGGAAKAMADPWTQLKNTLGDVAENVGFVLLPSINTFASALNSMFSGVAGGTNTFKEFGIQAAVILANMGGMLAIAVTQWELFFVKLGLDAAHFFTSSLPVYFTWFRDNWSDVFFTAGDYALTVLINLGSNIRTIFANVMKAVRGEMNFSDIFNGVERDLAKGAANSLRSLPTVPERVVTEFEQSLQRDINAMNDHVGTEMEALRAKLAAQFNTNGSTFSGTNPGAFGELDASAASAKAKDSAVSAAVRGSSAAFSSIFANMRRGNDQQKALTLAQKSLNEQAKIAQNTAKFLESQYGVVAVSLP